ncbi:MAG: hypothetical protein DMG81_05230 [Acidobacteria bacterium]|nr:MAG: hypothetical protein DMG81_05230 [Acidobacteriota bacterium]
MRLARVPAIKAGLRAITIVAIAAIVFFVPAPASATPPAETSALAGLRLAGLASGCVQVARLAANGGRRDLFFFEGLRFDHIGSSVGCGGR